MNNLKELHEAFQIVIAKRIDRTRDDGYKPLNYWIRTNCRQIFVDNVLGRPIDAGSVLAQPLLFLITTILSPIAYKLFCYNGEPLLHLNWEASLIFLLIFWAGWDCAIIRRPTDSNIRIQNQPVKRLLLKSSKNCKKTNIIKQCYVKKKKRCFSWAF